MSSLVTLSKFLIRNLMALALVVALGVGCNDSDGDGPTSQDQVGDNDLNTVVAVGDSITLGVGIAGAESYPAQLAGTTGKRVINAGVSGDRSDEGLARVPGLLAAHKPAFLLVILGTNDALQLASTTAMAENIRRIVQLAKDNNTIPVLATLPPLYGPRGFAAATAKDASAKIRTVASQEGVDLVDLESAFGTDMSLILSDGVHPTASGASLIASKMQPQVQ